MEDQEAAVRIRHAVVDDALGIAQVNVRAWQAAYRGILPDSYLDALDPAGRADRLRELLRPPVEGRFIYVAETLRAGDLPAPITGFSSGGPEREGLVSGGVRYEGEVYALYVAPEYQRRGLGRRLVSASAAGLIEQGTTSIVIWTLQDNHPARAFYEALGGTFAGEKSVTIGPSNLLEVAYGWPDARTLLRAAKGTVEKTKGRSDWS